MNKNLGEKMKNKRERTNCKLCGRNIAVELGYNGTKILMQHCGIGDESYWANIGNMPSRMSFRPNCFGSRSLASASEVEVIKRALKINQVAREKKEKRVKECDYQGNENRRNKHLRMWKDVYDNLDRRFNIMLTRAEERA
jgi:hypothetical protein